MNLSQVKSLIQLFLLEDEEMPAAMNDRQYRSPERRYICIGLNFSFYVRACSQPLEEEYPLFIAIPMCQGEGMLLILTESP